MFLKAQRAEDLVLLRQARPSIGQQITCPPGRYPEGWFRLKLHLDDPEAIFCDDPQAVAESSPLFWDEGTAVQILLCGRDASGGDWSLSLTRWGVLRFEFRRRADEAPALAVESRASIHTLVDVGRPFYAGVAIINPMATGEFSLPENDRTARARVRLLVGSETGSGLAVVGQVSGYRMPELCPLPERLCVGAREDGLRPARAGFDEFLVANTELFQLVDDPRPAATTIQCDFPGGSAFGACRVDEQTIALSAGVEFETSSFNYWHFFQVRDPQIRRVQIERVTEMSSCFFTSADRREWSPAPLTRAGLTPQGDQRGVVQLPLHEGPLYVANAPVYGEMERDADLEQARRLGAEVNIVATSTGGLPVHAVTLTDPGTPLVGKVGVVLLCGQHSPVEQMGGWLGLPCMRRLLELHQQGAQRGLLRQLVFYWIPILNIDCAHWGLPGNTLLRTNPNRQWMRNLGPEQQGVEQYLRAQRDEGVRMALLLDIHAGGAWRNHTILADYHADAEACRDPDRLPEPDRSKRTWFALLDQVAGLREVWVNPCQNVLQRAPEWFQHEFAAPGFTLEMSVVSHFDPAARRTRRFTHQSILDLGGRLAEAFAAGLEMVTGSPDAPCVGRTPNPNGPNGRQAETR